MATIDELIKQRAEIERQIQQLKDSSRNEAIATIRQLMADNNLTAEDISSARSVSKKTTGGSATKGSSVAPKYQDPATGKTWTGRGLKPKWVQEALQNGKSLEDLTIKA